MSLDLVNDSIFEFKDYYNNCDTAILHYSYGKYNKINRGTYLLNSVRLDTSSFPIQVIENSYNPLSDSLMINLRTNISHELSPQIEMALEIDSLSISVRGVNLDTIISNRQIQRIRVITSIIDNNGLPKFNNTIIGSNIYSLKCRRVNKLIIDFPIYDYLFNYVQMNNQLVMINRKFITIKSANGDRKVRRGSKIYHWWPHNPWEEK